MTRTEDSAASSAPGVRAATHVPRTWRQYLSLRPEVVALVALVASVAVIGAIAHRTIFFQIYEVALRRTMMRVPVFVPVRMCACLRACTHVCIRFVLGVVYVVCAGSAPWHARVRLLQAVCCLAAHPCISITRIHIYCLCSLQRMCSLTLQAGSGLAAHPCIFEYKSKIGGDIQDWRVFLKSPLKVLYLVALYRGILGY